MYTALTIAGSDSCGGAGIQADIKTMCAHGVYAMSAITALTAQNTIGINEIMEVTPLFLHKQLDAIFTDITPDAVKIGMLSDANVMKQVAMTLIRYKAKHIVLDPVMVSTSGCRLMQEDSAKFMVEELFPMAEIITPNIPETEVLTDVSVKGVEDMIDAAEKLYEMIKVKKQNKIQKLTDRDSQDASLYDKDTAVLVKGGHSINDANDILICNGNVILIKGQRIDNPNTHGTGCTLSSAIACNLAKGANVETSVRNAKEYLSGALRSNLDLGHGSGPVDHLWNITKL